MKRFTPTCLLIATLVATWLIVGCQSPTPSPLGSPKAFGGDDDVAYAKRLWSHEMKNYKSWATYPGFEDWQDGNPPHGGVLRYYVNSTASKHIKDLPHGSIIVKENYNSKSNDALDAVTIMKRIKGYDPVNADWFWAKFLPDGNLDKNPKGIQLAGRVAKGMSKGCIACHSKAEGGDYLFVND